MRIDNNYTQYRQPNFGSLKSIKFSRMLSPKKDTEEVLTLMQALKESKALNEFFKHYDTNVYFDRNAYQYQDGSLYKWASVNLDVLVKFEGMKIYPKLVFLVDTGENKVSHKDLINRLAQKIKDLEFSELKCSLCNEIEASDEIKDLIEKKQYEEIMDIKKSLLSQNSSEQSKKNTFFGKLFSWLKKLSN